MKDSSFRRTSNRETGRKFGEAPILGKVTRSPGSAVFRSSGRRRKAKKKKGISKVALAWTYLLAFVAIGALLFFIVTYIRTKSEQTAESQDRYSPPNDFESPYIEPAAPETTQLEGAEAIKLVRSALANRDPSLVADFFELGDLGDPRLALVELQGISEREGEVTGTKWLGQSYHNGLTLGEVVVFMDKGKRPLNRLAQLTLGSDGKWRINLDSYLRKAIPSWEKILSGESTTSVVRVFLAYDTYYNGIYSDEAEWQSYALASPDIGDILYAYAKRGSSQDKALRRILASENKFHRTTLGISKNPESKVRQFVIARVIAENWVVGENDFDERF